MKETATYYEVYYINEDGRDDSEIFSIKESAMKFANYTVRYLPNNEPDLDSVKIYEITAKEVDFVEL